jgi:vacuolar-type H+-ATPase subunit E/Vma4
VAALAEEARAAVGEPCTIDVSAEDGRITATSADGRRRVENSLEGRLRRAQVAAEHLVAEHLFGGAREGQ